MKRVILTIISIITILITLTLCIIRSQTSKNEKTVPLRFIVMADSRGENGGINLTAIEKTMESIKNISPQPSFAVMSGDLVTGSGSYSEEKAQLMHFKEVITKYYPINFFYPGFGNHEATAGEKGEQAFSEVFSEFKGNFLDGYNRTVYYFDKGNSRFYMLNSNHPDKDHKITNTQLSWIKTNTDIGKKHNFYFFHEPAYPTTAAHIGSSLDANKLQRDKIWALVDSSESPMVFCGHEHLYSRRHINSDFNETIEGQEFKFNKLTYQVTVGTFGAPIVDDDIGRKDGVDDKKDVDVSPILEYNYAVVDVNGDKIQVTVYNLDGKVIDSFLQ